jgi:hypothetical protein
MPFERASGEGVDLNLGLLSHRHVSELGFLEVGDHPDIRQWRERGDLAPNGNELPRLYLALSDHPILGSDNAGVAQVDFSHLETGFLSGQGGFRLGFLGAEYIELARGRHFLGPVLLELRGELRMGGL